MATTNIAAPPAEVAGPDEILNLGQGKSLAFRGDALVVKDKAFAKRSRSKFCGISVGSVPAEISIPFYHVLWAEVLEKEGPEEARLVIDYVTVKHTRPAKLAFSLAADLSPRDIKLWVVSLLDKAYGLAQRRKRAKVLVNPHAGPGGADRIWEREVKPIMDAARMSLDVVRTKRTGEAVEIAGALELDAYDVVIPCSGDGLPHEIWNGLGRRPDARRALSKLAMAPIPCGSGNGISLNVNGTNKPNEAALAVVKGVRSPLDMVCITQGDRPPLLSFLSQSMGIVAESDLGTEHMRWMGPTRFTVGVIQRIFSKKVYPCEVSMKVELEDKQAIKAHFKRAVEASDAVATVAAAAKEGTGSPSSVGSDRVKSSEGGLPPLRFGTINDKVPDDWETHSFDKMGNFYAGSMAHMAPDANFFQAALPNDGLLDLVTNDGDIPLMKYVDLMTSLDTESYFNNPSTTYRKLAAYRLTPKDPEKKGGYISIDGEAVPFEPFQAEICPALATVICKRTGKFENNGPPGWKGVVV